MTAKPKAPAGAGPFSRPVAPPQFPSTPIQGGSFGKGPGIPVGNPTAGPTLNGQANPFNVPNVDDDDFDIDLSGIDSDRPRFDYIGIGRHLAIVESVDKGRSSQKQTPYVEFRCRVLSGDYAGKVRPLYCYLTENARWTLDRALKAVAFQMPAGQKPTYKDIERAVPGIVVTMVVIPDGNQFHEDGRQYTRFELMESPEEFGYDPGTKIDPVTGQPR